MGSLDFVVDRIDPYLRGMFHTVKEASTASSSQKRKLCSDASPNRNFSLNVRRLCRKVDAFDVEYLSVKSFDVLDVEVGCYFSRMNR
jgi:hypothetical protein